MTASGLGRVKTLGCSQPFPAQLSQPRQPRRSREFPLAYLSNQTSSNLQLV